MENTVSTAVQNESNRKWWQIILQAPAGRPLIWAMIEYWGKTATRQLIAIVAFFVLFTLISGNNPMFAVVLLLSMVLHEYGHLFFFLIGGIKAALLFLFPLGAVAAPLNQEENKKSDLLHMNHLSYLVEAGPFVNLVLLILGTVMGQSEISVVRDFASHLVSINGILGLSNLIPIWNLDAGLLYKMIFTSLNKKEDWIVSWIQTFGILGITAALILIPPQGLILSNSSVLVNSIRYIGWILTGFFVVSSIWHKQGIDDDTLSESPNTLTNPQVFLHIAIWAVMVVTFLWFYAGAISF